MVLCTFSIMETTNSFLNDTSWLFRWCYIIIIAILMVSNCHFVINMDGQDNDTLSGMNNSNLLVNPSFTSSSSSPSASEMISKPLTLSSQTLVKCYVSPLEVQLLGLKLGHLIMKDIDNFKPNWMIALWRGGAPFGMMVQEFLKSKQVVVDHICARTSSYTAPGTQNATVQVHALDYVLNHCKVDDKVLIVDDVFETGKSIQALLEKMRMHMGDQMPKHVRIATAFYKPQYNKTQLIPDYVAKITDEWLVFPHEISDMDGPDEIRNVMGEQVLNHYLSLQQDE